MEGMPAPMIEPPAVSPAASPIGTLAYHNPELPPPPEGWTNVSEHVPNPAKFWPYLFRAMGWRLLSFAATYGMLAVFVVWGWPLRESLLDGAVLAGCLLISMLINLARLGLRLRSEYRTVRFQVADQGVQRLAVGYSPLVVRFAEVKKAQRFPRMILLRTAQREKYVTLTDALTGYDEIVARVSAALPLAEQKRPGMYLVGRAVLVLSLSAAVMGLYYGALMTPWLWLEILLTVVFTGTMAWSLRAVIRSPHQKKLTKMFTSISIGMMVVILLTKIVLTHLLAR